MSEKPASEKRPLEGRRSRLGPRGSQPESNASGNRAYQTVGGRRAIRKHRSERSRTIIGVAILTVMIVSVTACFWFGWRINHDLARLEQLKLEFTRESEANRELIARRDSLLEEKTIIRKAAVLGLFPPTTNQVRKP